MVSEAYDFEMAMMEGLAREEIPDEAVNELIADLDADKDGTVSKADFMKTGKRVLFDPNPPQEVVEAVNGMMDLIEGQPCIMGGPPPPMAICGPQVPQPVATPA